MERLATMIKRSVLILTLIVTLISALPLTAGADAIVEPVNDFHVRNKKDCISLERNFFANGSIGFVSLREEPGSAIVVNVVDNGEVLYIISTYNHKGKIWGITGNFSSYEADGKPINGWIMMDQLLVVYDYISFEEDFGHEFYDFDGSPDAMLAVDEIVFWTWPGSGVNSILGQPYKERSFDDYFDRQSESGAFPDQGIDMSELIPYAYRDEAGREWVFLSRILKYHGKTWVCLSDPSNADIPMFNPAPEPRGWQPDKTHTEPPGSLPLPIITIVLVAALVGATALLIWVFRKKSKNKDSAS